MNCTLPIEDRPEDAEWARIFIWTANSIGFIYNIPQVVHTVRTNKTADISSIFLWLRFVSGLMWCFYSAYFFMYDVLVSWGITLTSTLIILYYKYLYKDTQPTIQKTTLPPIENTETKAYTETDYDIIVLKEEEMD